MILIAVLLLAFSVGLARYAMQRHQDAMKMGAGHTMPGGQTAAEVAREFMDDNEARDVQIVEHNALVSDYYDPKRRTLFLNRATMDGTSAAAWALALHEAAHALQEGEARKALDRRLSNIRLARYAPTIIAVACLTLGFLKRLPFRHALLICGILFAVIAVLNIMSMPVEVNASQRVQAWIEYKLRKHPALLEIFTALLARVAWRDSGALARSPVYLLTGMLPVGGKLRK
jgi:Zn-dependent membrane protease YugP